VCEICYLSIGCSRYLIVCTNMLLRLDKVLDHLKKIDPMLQHIKLDKKKAEPFPRSLEGFAMSLNMHGFYDSVFKATSC